MDSVRVDLLDHRALRQVDAGRLHPKPPLEGGCHEVESFFPEDLLCTTGTVSVFFFEAYLTEVGGSPRLHYFVVFIFKVCEDCTLIKNLVRELDGCFTVLVPA